MSPDHVINTSTERTQLPVRLPTEQYEALRTYAFFNKTSMNEVVIQAISHFLAGPARQQQLTDLLGRAQEDYRIALDKLENL